ncbi:MAG: hypothetical protein HYS87_03410 [Candidatus Colwellbacteria bacterium]|nr:hypothetical protein [Candidatus Colwellbacteria bacterium]
MPIIKDPVIVSAALVSIAFWLIALFIGLGGLTARGGDFIINYTSEGLPVTHSIYAIKSVLWITSAIIFINLVLTYEFFYRKKFLSYAIAFFTVLLALIVAISMSMVLYLN